VRSSFSLSDEAAVQARIIHEPFCLNHEFAAAMSLGLASSPTGTSIDNHTVGTHTSPHLVHGEQHQYGHHVVEPPNQCTAWQPRRGGGCLAGLGLVLTLGNLSRRSRRRRVSNLAGAHDWIGLGLGHPVAWRGESCVAHRHNGSGPLDHDGADRRTTGDDPLSRSDGTPFGNLLDHSLLWALQTSRPAHRRLLNQCNRQPATSIAIMTPPLTQMRPTTFRSDRHRHRI